MRIVLELTEDEIENLERAVGADDRGSMEDGGYQSDERQTLETKVRDAIHLSRHSPISGNFESVVFKDGIPVGIRANGKLYALPDGVNWTVRP